MLYIKIYQHVSPRFKDDKVFVSDVLSQDGDLLEFVSDRLKDDEDVVRIATKRNGYPLQYASDRLRSDKDLVAQCGLEYATDAVKDDKDFVLQHPTMLEFASERLKDDKEVVMSAVSTLGKLVYFASERLRSDPDVTDAAIAQDPTSVHFIHPLPYKKKLTRRFSRGYSNQGNSSTCGYHAFSKVILNNVFGLLHPLRETSVYVEQQCNRYLNTTRFDLSELTPEKCSPDGYLKILLFLHLFYLYKSVDRSDGMLCGSESSIFPSLFEMNLALSYRHRLALKETLDYMYLKKKALQLELQYFRFEPSLEAIKLLTDAGLYVMLSVYYSPDKIGHALVVVGTDGDELLYKDSYGVEEVNRIIFGRRFRLRNRYYDAKRCSLVIPVQGTHDTLKEAFANYLYLKKNINQLLLHEGFV